MGIRSEGFSVLHMLAWCLHDSITDHGAVDRRAVCTPHVPP